MKLISFYRSGPVCEPPSSRPCTSFILNPAPPLHPRGLARVLVQICESLLTEPSLPRSPGSHANSSGSDLIESACLRGQFTCLVGGGLKGKQGEITCC